MKHPLESLENSVFTTKAKDLLAWARKNSIWPYPFGTACCGIEYMAVVGPKYDIARFGAEVVRFSPRQSDLLVVAGTITEKMAPVIKKVYDQMAEPKWVMAMGACASGGGPFKEGYNVVSGVDKFIPVDVYVPGCPPTPQALLHGLMTLQQKIDHQSIRHVPWYQSGVSEPIPVPILGPDLIDPRHAALLRDRAARGLSNSVLTADREQAKE